MYDDKLGELHQAAHSGDAKKVQALLDKGVPVNSTSDGRTALHYAVMAGRTDIVRLLLENGAGVDGTQSKYGKTSLHVAVEEWRPGIARLLIDWGANLDAQDEYGLTPLILAVKSQREDVLRGVLNWGANVNLASEKDDRWTPLQYAVIEKNERLVKLLLERGADPTQQNKWGKTAMDTAHDIAHRVKGTAEGVKANAVEKLLHEGKSEGQQRTR